MFCLILECRKQEKKKKKSHAPIYQWEKLDKWQSYNLLWTYQRTTDTRKLNNLNWWRDNFLQREKECIEWITCAEQGRKRCQPPFLYPDSTNGTAVSRHKCYYLSLYKSTQDVWPSIKNYKTQKKNKSIFKRQRNDPNVGGIRQGTLITV